MAKSKYKSDINLFESIFKDKSRKVADLEKQLKDTLRVFGCIAAAAVVIMLIVNGTTKARISFTQRETESLATPETLAEIEENKQLAASLKTENEMLQTELDSINASIKLTMRDIEEIAGCQPTSIVVSNFSYSGGKINLSCTSTDELGGANFANALRVSKKFDTVEYSGVSKGGEGSYTFTMDIGLKNDSETAGEANKNE